MSLSTDLLRELRTENQRLKTENQSLMNELIRLRQSIRSLFRLQSKLDQINVLTEPFDVINTILSVALDAVNSRDGSLMLLDEDTHELVFVHVLGSAQKQLTGYRLPPGQGIASYVVNTRTAKLVLDVSQEPRFSPLVDQLTGFLTTSLICVPLLDNYRALGAIEVVNSAGGNPFRKEDLDIMQLVARLATLAILKSDSMAAP
jgi:sigma-B regulation protein RsbU (phosphoserine phosphatase)